MKYIIQKAISNDRDTRTCLVIKAETDEDKVLVSYLSDCWVNSQPADETITIFFKHAFLKPDENLISTERKTLMQ